MSDCNHYSQTFSAGKKSVLSRDRETFKGNNKTIAFFLYFSPGIAPVRRNSKELITANIPAQADMFDIARAQKRAGFRVAAGG